MIAVVSDAIGLIVAAAVLEDMTLGVSGLVIAVLIFKKTLAAARS